MILKGRGPCQDAAAKVRAVREALAQAEAAAAGQGGESGGGVRLRRGCGAVPRRNRAVSSPGS